MARRALLEHHTTKPFIRTTTRDNTHKIMHALPNTDPHPPPYPRCITVARLLREHTHVVEQSVHNTTTMLTPWLQFLLHINMNHSPNCVPCPPVHLYNRGGARPSTADLTASGSTVSPSPCGNGKGSRDQCSTKLAS